VRDIFFEKPSRQPLLIYITQQDDRQRHCSSSHDGFGSPMQIQVFAQLNLARHCEAEGRGNPGRFIKDLEKTMTAIEFENISKQYRLGLVSTGTLSQNWPNLLFSAFP